MRLTLNLNTSQAESQLFTAKHKEYLVRTSPGLKMALNYMLIHSSKYTPNQNIRQLTRISIAQIPCSFQVHEYKVGKDLIKSKMEIDPATQKDSGFYECQADNKFAIDKRGFRTDYTLDVY